MGHPLKDPGVSGKCPFPIFFQLWFLARLLTYTMRTISRNSEQ